MIGKLSDEQIEELLTSNTFGRVGCNDGFNTYIYPINYVYNGKFILCHSQPGSKIQVMRQNKRVCLQVDRIEHETNWKSVLVLGEYQEIEDERERYNAITVLVQQHLHIKLNEEYFSGKTKQQDDHQHDQLNNRPVIFRIAIDEKTGRYENH